jgi:RND family efflux transporter MFP subunit
MKKLSWITVLLLVSILVAACGSAATTTPIPEATPVATQTARQTGTVIASAEAAPVQISKLSFALTGPVKEVGVKVGDRVQIGQTLATLDKPEMEDAIQAAEANVRGRTADLAYYLVSRKHKPPERRELAQAKLDAANAALDTAKASFSQATLAAPFDGTIIEVDIEPGEIVQPGQVVILLANLDNLQIETTDLSERDIALVKVNQKATVYVEALDRDFPGRVVKIAPRSNDKNGDTVFKVTVELDQQPDGLLWGMSSEVRIDTGP